jgi:hypothetical protein
MLARQLLDDALIQAENFPQPVCVTARLHIARVLTAYSKEDARALLLRALREMEQLVLGHHDRQLIQREAHMLTAAIAPDLIMKLPPLDERMMRHYEFPLFRTMLDHGNADAAFDLLIHFDHSAQFPHMAVPMVLQYCADGERKLALVRRAIQAWRDSPVMHAESIAPRRSFGRFEFLNTFVHNWMLLQEGEALVVARELVVSILNKEDAPT